VRFATRLTLTAAVAVAIGLVTALVGAYLLTAQTLVGTVDRSLDEVAAELVGPTDGPGPAGPFQRPRRIATELRREGALVQLVDEDGTVVGRTAGDAGFDPPPDTGRVAAGELDLARATIDVDGARVRVLTIGVGDGLALQLARPLGEVQRALAQLRVRLVVGALVGTALALALGALASRRATRPVRELTELAEQVTATGDLARRIDPVGDDELARLGRTIDAMLSSVEQARTAQEQLVADASHELRTPLASLRTNAEVLADTDRLEPTERRELAADVVEQLDEVTRLIADLVELARGARPAPPGAEPVQLDVAARRAVERLRGVTGDRRIHLDLAPAAVRGDADRLERVITNLVLNALRHGAGDVEVTVRPADEGGRLRVRDHGPGFAAADLPRIFDRFYRAESARGIPGSGLGLAIVRQTVEAHGGTVSAGNDPAGGAAVEVQLPAALGASPATQPVRTPG
jgi:two-component system, OmpR family, sensor histidine kinase MprB